ncbi:MAG TPA: hypothetical protein PKM57_10440 [Kiritimatiellia bacterium]|nr:hypothetical protein [Kiritimatiellia bacterium]HPS07471.1 hypothetical protein [Kiritimatiellia bacterium]
MRDKNKRLERLEKKASVERVFVAWGDPWTPEQKAEAIRREPERRIFWRSLVDVSKKVIADAAEKERLE